MINKSDQRMYQAGLVFLVILCIGTGIILVVPADKMKLISPCLFRMFTGLYCPGCGGTRAFQFMLRGRLIKSIYYHPLVLYGFGFYAIYMIGNTVQIISRGRIKTGIRYQDRYVWIGLVILALNFIIKNLMLLIWNIRL